MSDYSFRDKTLENRLLKIAEDILKIEEDILKNKEAIMKIKEKQRREDIRSYIREIIPPTFSGKRLYKDI